MTWHPKHIKNFAAINIRTLPISGVINVKITQTEGPAVNTCSRTVYCLLAMVAQPGCNLNIIIPIS